ncbi:MAG: hypothetical protein OXG88_04130 [Gammaproteobacteria bacterium]|nr:hypothetical protein [Gammaproteobacteria bacterium]
MDEYLEAPSHGGIAAILVCLKEIIKEHSETDADFAARLEKSLENWISSKSDEDLYFAKYPNTHHYNENYKEGFDAVRRILFGREPE